MVGFFHGRGMIECFRYEGNINEKLFLQFVRDRFLHVFSKKNNQKGKLFLQDGGTSNNCKMSQESMDKISYRLFMTPSWSPDLNTIENIFDFVGMCLRKDAFMKKIKRETYEQFCNCITNTLHNFPSDIIAQTIASMPNLLGTTNIEQRKRLWSCWTTFITPFLNICSISWSFKAFSWGVIFLTDRKVIWYLFSMFKMEGLLVSFSQFSKKYWRRPACGNFWNSFDRN